MSITSDVVAALPSNGDQLRELVDVWLPAFGARPLRRTPRQVVPTESRVVDLVREEVCVERGGRGVGHPREVGRDERARDRLA
jgi:hypothetical protein